MQIQINDFIINEIYHIIQEYLEAYSGEKFAIGNLAIFDPRPPDTAWQRFADYNTGGSMPFC